MRYTVILEKEEVGGYSVSVPELPGCVSQGETEEEALSMIRDAIELYLMSFQDAPEPYRKIATVDVHPVVSAQKSL